jgi:hypothetical protein
MIPITREAVCLTGTGTLDDTPQSLRLGPERGLQAASSFETPQVNPRAYVGSDTDAA